MLKRIICWFRGHRDFENPLPYLELKTGKVYRIKICFRCGRHKYKYTGEIAAVSGIDVNKPVSWKNYIVEGE
jgi:hypothetical protein